MFPLVPFLVPVLATASLVVPSSLPSSCLLPPVHAPITDHFRDPCPYCPGNRGLTYAVAPGTPVRAMAAGRVSFSGVVAGTRYVVVEHADGLRATYGELASTHLTVDDRVAAGAVVGRTSDTLHVGLRRGETYLDPEPLLGRLVGRPYLVPTDGTGRRPPPPPRLVCAGSASVPPGRSFGPGRR